MVRLILTLIALALCASAAAQDAPPQYHLFDKVAVMAGDNPDYARPEFDDRGWERFAPVDIEPQGRLIWVRAHIDGERLTALQAGRPLGFFLYALASREVYFNGVSIGAAGAPGATPAEEIPGALDQVFYIPDRLIRPGDNVFAVRMSSHHLGAHVHNPVHAFHIAPYRDSASARLRVYVPAIAAGGAIALGAIYFFGLFAANRKNITSLALGLVALAALAQLGAETWRAFDRYDYPLHMTRLYAILAFAFLTGAALAAYSCLRFAPRLAKFILPAAALLSLAGVVLAPGYDHKTAIAFLAFLLGALAAALAGLVAKRPGAAYAALGFGALLAAAFFAPWSFLDQIYYLGIAALIVALFILQIRLLETERRARQEADLRAIRLRHELLNRQIQPHFLMNTLTTLAEWIESDPRTGVKMIDSLGGEMRLLYEMSEKSRVSFSEEIELCRRHLEVMSLRAAAEFTLSVNEPAADFPCPPAILLTLIENAFTHNEYRDDAVFEIRAAETGGRVAIVCRTPMRRAENTQNGAGAGLAYIRARLAEAFDEDWSMNAGPENGFWATTISWTAR